MNKILNVYKPLGKTPLQVIQKVRKQYPEYASEKIGYAGRLDPLAQGVLLLMIGDATKERDNYLDLEKEYEFEVVFGLETDTYDMMGLLKANNLKEEIGKEKIKLFVSNHQGILMQSYPPYSSKTVNGKPLFWWAKNKKLDKISIPQRKITVMSFTLNSINTISKEDLEKQIKKAVQMVSGDFRQDEIMKVWSTFFSKTLLNTFTTAKFTVSCSSGTYVRGLVHELGQFLGSGAIALSIKRTKVGSYTLQDSLRLFVSDE